MAQGGTWSSILDKVFGQKLELDLLVFVLARVILFPLGPHGQDVQDERVLAQSLLLPMLTTNVLAATSWLPSFLATAHR